MMNTTSEPLLTTTEAAKLIGWHENTLRRKRSQGEDSPDYIEVGRYRMYERAAVEAWKLKNKRKPVKAK